jgi:hypothetical protein
LFQKQIHTSSKNKKNINFCGKSKLIYHFNVNLKASTYQIVILQLFNEKTEYIVKDIQDLTQIKMETLVQVLVVLFKSKLLVSDEEEIEENDINPNTAVRLFLNYKKY